MRATAWLAGVVLVLTGCGAGDQPDGATAQDSPSPSTTEPTEPSHPTDATEPTEPTEPTDPTTRPATGTVVITADSEFGVMLYDKSGQAIYLFDKETSSTPECYDACAEAWPPVLTEGDPQIRGQVRPELVGTTERRDGSTQVTYNGHPLYYYAHEDKWQVLCHNIEEYGGLWLVVTPEGEAAPV